MKWLLLGLKPPELPVGREPTEAERCAYLKQNRRQKHAIAYMVWFLMVSFTVYFFWSRGELADVISPGFAYAADVDAKRAEMKNQLDAIANNLNQLVINQLRSDMREARRLQCIARNEKNMVLASKYGEDLDALREQFYSITNREWNQPRCEDL